MSYFKIVPKAGPGDKPDVKLPDNPIDDNTPFAHPAFWRGQDDGVRGAVMVIRRVLDGKDNGTGIIGDEGLEKLRRDILTLVPPKTSVGQCDVP